ncbi:hypothetical protein [Nonomuraea insulae]|uniref:DUF2169 domain-containing protein n=1 Tax=Nonomuraea insulae TaxID=1616787 RepID=A0ABW1D2Q1_9ACTN
MNAYSFLPWLRTGIATLIAADPGGAERASVPVRLLAAADDGARTLEVKRDVQLYGPGDVIGVDARAISRVEPRPGVVNFEPNFLAHIEFSEEDFVWRYSPASPAPARLAPWLALVVLARGTGENAAGAEFAEAGGRGPLPSIAVHDPAGTLPPPAQLGAWAHVHVNGPLAGPVAADGTAAVLGALGEVLRTNPDSACSRLICPRRLRPDTAYEAFLVPAFESGRLAGLGLDPNLAPGALYSAWGPPYANRPVPGQLPYYHRWSFSTGDAGDFEFLVRLLRARPADPRVGRRGLEVPGVTTPPQLAGVLPLGGALRVPDVPIDLAENWDNFHGAPPTGTPYPHPFEQALAAVVNLADDYQRHTPADANAAVQGLAAPGAADPVIAPPLYGRWHALTSRLLTRQDGSPLPAADIRNWVHRLNLDPRFRVAANLGGEVVRAHDEELMAAAWEQVGDVLAANGRIRAAQLAREVGHVLQVRHLDPAPSAMLETAGSGRSLRLTAPAHPRVTTTASPLSALLEPAGPVEKVAVRFRVATSQVAAAPLSPAMRRITRPGSRLMRTLPFTPERPPDALIPRMDADIGRVTAAPAKRAPAALVTADALDAELHPGAAGDPVDRLPKSPDFVIREIGDPIAPTPGTADGPEAVRFKDALRELHQGIDEAAAVGRTEPARPQLGVDAATTDVLDGLRADETVPRTLLDSVALPERLRPFASAFIEAMAYPIFDLPAFRPLLELGTDAFVPNLGLLPPNSITLLETNAEFIEAYMAGLNHEMARELLWREYPTDQRGTPFRQFWDPRVALPLPNETPAQRRERGYDIPPLHEWPTVNELGTNARGRDDLVLVIRGDLLRKYPNAAVYAQKAEWPPGGDGLPDRTQQRRPVDPPGGLSPALVRLPTYEAKVEPDIYLLGFDLTAEEAAGGPDDAGWFFVLKERPGDPRFGLDEGAPVPVEVWNDLTWDAVDPQGRGFLTLDPATTVELAGFDGSGDEPEKRDQRAEDESVPRWFSGLGSADLAYILCQVPVLVAVHAQEMLPR